MNKAGDEPDESTDPNATGTLQANEMAEVVTVATASFMPRLYRNVVQPNVYQPLPEVLMMIEECRKHGEGRSVTAILRIAQEQLNLREFSRRHLYFVLDKVVPAILSAILIALMVTGHLAEAVLTLILSSPLLLFYRDRVPGYPEENRKIIKTSVDAIAELVEAGKLPRRLYKDDYRMMAAFSSIERSFRPIEQTLLEAVA